MITLVFLLFAIGLVLGETSLGPVAHIGKRVLVLLDDDSIRSTHSVYFADLAKRGYELTFKSADDPTLVLQQYGEWVTDNLIIFAPTVEEFGGFVDVASVLEFVDAGRNVVVAADPFLGAPVREIASECGVEFDEAQSLVIDHFQFDASDAAGDHTLLVADQLTQSPVFTGAADQPFAPLLFRGVGQDVAANAKMIYKLATGSPTAYSHAPDEPVEAPPLSGRDTVLVSALQARNNARVVFSGSLELFSDAFFRAQVQRPGAAGAPQPAGNRRFAEQVTAWCFQERGALRASNIRHGHADPEVARARHGQYRVSDDIVYEIDVEEFNPATGAWEPYAADDLQLEFIMLDPYVRLFLEHQTAGHYRAAFKLPDVYGVFTFRTIYNRPGYSHVETIARTPVRPFRHDEFPRFIDAAYPYYASAFSMMGGLFVLSFVFLHHRDE